MSNFHQLSQISERELLPGFHVKMLHVEGCTVAHFRIKEGSVLPEHSHVHEQVSNIISGEFEMTVEGETQLCKAGGVITIPSNAKHWGKALTDCYVIDVFQPVREDYRM